jgi:hypothetical protein
MASLADMARFDYQKLKEKRPTSPYRIITFSASGIIGVALTLLLESDGDHIGQLAFLDNFPTIFTCPEYDPTRFVSDDGTFTTYITHMIDNTVGLMQDIMSRDRAGPKHEQIANDMIRAIHRLPTTDFARYFVSDTALGQFFRGMQPG